MKNDNKLLLGRYNLEKDKPDTQKNKQLKNFTEIDLEASIYVKQLTNESINKLPTLNKRNAEIDTISKETIYTTGRYKITLKNLETLSINTHKTLRKVLEAFTRKNSMDNLKNSSVNYTVILDIEEMALERGDLEPKDLSNSKVKARKLRNFRAKLEEDADALTEKIKFSNPDKQFINTRYIAEASISNDYKYFIVILNPGFADDLLTSNVFTNFPKSLYLIDARDKNTYALANALNDHFAKFSNQRTNKKTNRKPTYDRLKVSTCLSYLPEIMTHEEALKKSRSWKKRIKDVLENCLEKLAKLGYLIEWHYGFSNGEILSNEDMNKYMNDYYKWSELNIYFTPCRYWELLSTDQLAREKKRELKELDKLYQ